MFKPHKPAPPEQPVKPIKGERWQPWEMEKLRHKQPQPAAAPASSAKERLQQQLQRRQQELDQARADAQQQGYEEGFAAGRQEGYQQGLEQGHAEAFAAGHAKAEEALAPLLALAESFSAAVAQLDDDVAHALAELALTTGRKLAGEALAQQPEQILVLVRELLHTEPALSGEPRLWLHPQDFTLVEQHLAAELAAAGWQLQPDEHITRGGCRVTSVSGELDASWESRWHTAQQQLRAPTKTSPQ